jgi:hypothetical protein
MGPQCTGLTERERVSGSRAKRDARYANEAAPQNTVSPAPRIHEAKAPPKHTTKRETLELAAHPLVHLTPELRWYRICAARQAHEERCRASHHHLSPYCRWTRRRGPMHGTAELAQQQTPRMGPHEHGSPTHGTKTGAPRLESCPAPTSTRPAQRHHIEPHVAPSHDAPGRQYAQSAGVTKRPLCTRCPNTATSTPRPDRSTPSPYTTTLAPMHQSA